MKMTRFKAFLIHFSITLVIVVTVLLSVAFLWYPKYYFSASNVSFPVMMVVLVDAGLGPLMTLILFKPGKPGLKFDISVIAICQVLALIGGITVIYLERPALVVHHNGIFNCLSHQQVKQAGADLAKFKDPQAPEMPGVAHLPPIDTQEWNERQQHLVAEGFNVFLPAYVYGDRYQPLNAETVADLLPYELDVSNAVRTEPYASRWEQFTQKHADSLAQHAYFVLICSAYDHLIAVNRETGQLIDAVSIPFLNTKRKHFSASQQPQGEIADGN